VKKHLTFPLNVLGYGSGRLGWWGAPQMPAALPVSSQPHWDSVLGRGEGLRTHAPVASSQAQLLNQCPNPEMSLQGGMRLVGGGAGW